MIRRTFLKGAAAVSFSLMVSPALTAFAKDSVRVYVGGPIFTMNKNNDIAEAIAVKGETILAVGKKAEVMAAAGSGATVVDLKGKALIPGMIDGHSHFPSGAFNELTMVNLNVPPLGRAESIADMQSLLKERAAQTKKGEWIVGYNYNDLAIKEQRHPTRADLDAVSTEHPIFVKHVSGHLGVANSKALELAGITEETPNPEGGKFRRGPDGKLDGVLEGPAAQAPVSAIRPKPTAAQYEEAVRRDNMIYAAAGITTANNGGSPTVDDFFLKASENGDLGIRVVIWPNGRNAKLIAKRGRVRSWIRPARCSLGRPSFLPMVARRAIRHGSPSPTSSSCPVSRQIFAVFRYSIRRKNCLRWSRNSTMRAGRSPHIPMATKPFRT